VCQQIDADYVATKRHTGATVRRLQNFQFRTLLSVNNAFINRKVRALTTSGIVHEYTAWSPIFLVVNQDCPRPGGSLLRVEHRSRSHLARSPRPFGRPGAISSVANC